MNKLKFICLLSTVIHTAFIGWLTLGIEYFNIFIYAVPACILLMPITYYCVFKFFDILNTHLSSPLDNGRRYLMMSAFGEAAFLLVFIPTSMAIVVISHSS